MEKFPSAKEILEEAKKSGATDINALHSATFKVMLKHEKKYFKNKVSAFLKTTSLKGKQLLEISSKMLAPVKANGIMYSNFMDEASRRISQVFQVISGNLAELCIESSLTDIGLKLGLHYVRRKQRTDFTFYYPSSIAPKAEHRLEVKNVKLRERGTRGLAFDGDSMAGFFDDATEFTGDNIRVIEEHCSKTGGYCYMPPQTLEKIKHPTKKFRGNTLLASDMKQFVETGKLP